MIVPETDQQVDPIAYAPSLAKEIESEYGKQALEGLQKHRLQVRGAGGLDRRCRQTRSVSPPGLTRGSMLIFEELSC